MSSRIFIDSSVLIKYNKGKKQELLSKLLSDTAVDLYINETVISEFLFHFLKMNGNASPLSLQSSKKISSVIELSTDYKILRLFHLISGDGALLNLVPHYMQSYNLLPNDAIILATCKIHNVTTIASHDSDFIEPCRSEGIELLREE